MQSNEPFEEKSALKKAVSFESFPFLGLLGAFFFYLGMKMGIANMMNTILHTAYEILISTVFYIMAIAVVVGGFSELLSEFGVIAIANKLFSPLIKPIFQLPGAAIVGIFTTYFSDNPAILTLAKNQSFRRYFKKFQVPALTNIGTAFGMGMIVTTFVIGIRTPEGETLLKAALIGNIGAVIGGIVSTRLMLCFTANVFGKEEECVTDCKDCYDILNYRMVREGSFGSRFLEAILDGGKTGVEMGMTIIPGVLIICTIVLTLTNGPSASGAYTGAAFEGVGLLPWLGSRLRFILDPLFGFSSPECISVPITALGAAGAAISLIPKLIQQGQAHANDVAVFTAMCMCWSGFLSTHVAMMENLGCRQLTGKAIFSHTIGGIAAGIAANFLFKLVALI